MKQDDIEAAAYLTCLGKKPSEIQALLACSQPQVSRLVRAAEIELGYFRTIHQSLLTDEQEDRVRRRFFPVSDELARRWPDVREVVVLPHNQFSRGAAMYVKRILDNSRRAAVSASSRVNVGVAWGETLGGMVRELMAITKPEEKATAEPASLDALRFFPVCGGLLEGPLARVSPSMLTAELSRLFNIAPEGILDLSTVPAVVPHPAAGECESESASSIREGLLAYCRCVPSFRAIFEGPQALHAQANGLLTSLGPSKPHSEWNKQCLKFAGIPEEPLREYTWGDIAGAFLPKEGKASQVEEWADRFLTISLADIAECARRGLPSSSSEKPSALNPGVIVLAQHDDLVDVIDAAMRLRLVNVLILDEILAAKLTQPRSGLPRPVTALARKASRPPTEPIL